MSTHPAVRPAKHRWASAILLVLLIAIPIFEVWLLIQVGRYIGGLWLLLILVGEAALGGWLMRHEGARAWKALNEAFGTGKMPAGELADAALILVGGVLLMLPGFATDVIGFFFLLPFTRPAARQVLGYFVARRIQRLGLPLVVPRGGDVIEGETVEGPVPPTNEQSTSPQSTNHQSDPRIITGEIDDKR